MPISLNLPKIVTFSLFFLNFSVIVQNAEHYSCNNSIKEKAQGFNTMSMKGLLETEGFCEIKTEEISMKKEDLGFKENKNFGNEDKFTDGLILF